MNRRRAWLWFRLPAVVAEAILDHLHPTTSPGVPMTADSTDTAGTWRAAHREHISADQQRRAALLMDREIAEAERRREHYWLAIVGFRAHPPLADDVILDHEALRQYPVVGCFRCEVEWSADAPRRCPGEPSSRPEAAR